MSVSCRLQGRTGNEISIYSAARLFAELNGLKFESQQPRIGFLETTPCTPGQALESPYQHFDDRHDERNFMTPFKGKALFTGYHQKSKFFYPHRERVKSFFKLPPFTKNEKDLVMHVRLGDYWRLKWTLDPEYYLEALSREEGTFDRLFICTDEPANQTYFSAFKKYAPTMVHGTPESDFLFMRTFDRMVMGNSTFSFWAQFFGEPTRVYTPRQWNRVAYIDAAEFHNAVPLDVRFMYHPIRPADVTFVVPCMGRLDHLKQTLLKLAAQFKVVVVDWSCPQKTGAWARENAPQATVVEIQGKTLFDLSAARNAGAAVVQTPLIGFMDADTVPAHNFADAICQHWTNGTFLAMPDMPCPGYGGLLVCSKADFERAGQWDESAKGYGWEDIAFKLALTKLGVAKKVLPRNAISHLDHGNELRVQNYENKSIGASTVANRVALSPRIPRIVPAPKSDIPVAPPLRVGMLCIATNKIDYLRYAGALVASAKNFLFANTDVQVTWYLFTNWTKLPPGAVHCPILDEPWPMPTLKRYHYFCGQWERLASETDFLFYIDADMLFTGPVGHEILSEHVATLHPGFYKKPRAQFTYERNQRSKAYVAPNEGVSYFAGGFQGGKTAHFLAAMLTMKDQIWEDMNALVKAEHNDESHWNRYCIDAPPTLVLPPAYCYSPQRAIVESGEAIKPLITCVEKNNHRELLA